LGRTLPTLKCHKCGRGLDIQAKFCDSCGSPVIRPIGIEELEEEDWRGILAIGFTGAFAAISSLAFYLGGLEAFQAVAAIFGPMEGLILGFYFGGKSSELSQEELKAIQSK